MTAPTPNAELAYRVLDLARANGDSFEMGSWAWSLDGEPVGIDDLTKHDCGTTACLAGWTAAVMGYKVDSAAFVFDSGGNEVSQNADLFAARILGIDDDQAGRLFYASDSRVGRLVAEIFGPRPDGGEGGSLTGGDCPPGGCLPNFCVGADDCRREQDSDGDVVYDLDDVPPNAGSAS